MTSLLRASLYVGACLLLTNCTREVEKSAKIGISFSEQSSLSSSSEITHVVINVRGSGIPRVIKVDWDGHCDSAACNGQIKPMPPFFELDVPTGSKRLIQVLAVAQNSTTGSMSFKYGDVEKDLSPGFNDVTINTTSLEQTSASETKVFGRYIDVGGVTYTGRIRGEVQPPNAARPPMEIINHEVYGGWVKLMFLQGVNFKYFLEPTNQLLFNGASETSADFAASIRSLHVKMPATLFRQNMDPQGNSVFEREGFGKVITGFFGPGTNSTAFRVCYDPSVALGSSDVIDRLYASADTTTPIKWYGSASTPPANTVYPLAGGSGTLSTTACPTSSLYTDKLIFKPSTLTEGEDRMGGFKGPFILNFTGTGVQELAQTYDSANDTLSVNWTYLPGAFSGNFPLSGVQVFVKAPFMNAPIAVFPDGYSREAPCDQQLQAQGFVPYTGFYGSTNTSFILTGVTDQSQADVGVCPFRESFGLREYFSAYVRSYNSYSNTVVSPGLASVYFENGTVRNFFPTVIGASSTMVISIRNGSAVPASLSNFVMSNPKFRFAGGSFPGTGTPAATCSTATALAANSSCTMYIEYTPIAEGLDSGSLSFDFNSGGGAQSSLGVFYGSGVSSASGASLAFSLPYQHMGQVPFGSVFAAKLELKNYGSDIAQSFTGLSLSAPFSYSGTGFPGTNGNCGPALNPGASCFVEVQFAAAAVYPNPNVMLQVQYDSGGSIMKVASVQLEGESVAVGFTPNYHNINGVSPGSSNLRTFTFQNMTSGTITNMEISQQPVAPFTIHGSSTCNLNGSASATLAPGLACTVVVEYLAPPTGNHSAGFTLRYNAGTTTLYAQAGISGSVAGAASLSLSATSLDFGKVAPGVIVVQTLAIENPSSTTTASYSPFVITGSGSADFAIVSGAPAPACNISGGTIPPLGFCNVSIRYQPPATSEAYGATSSSVLSLPYNLGASQTAAVSLSGAPGALLGVPKYFSLAQVSSVMPWADSTCYGLDMELMGENGEPVSASAALTAQVQIDATKPLSVFGSQVDCINNANTLANGANIPIALGTSIRQVWIKKASPGGPGVVRFTSSAIGFDPRGFTQCFEFNGSTGCGSSIQSVYPGFPKVLDSIKVTSANLPYYKQTESACDNSPGSDCFFSGLYKKYQVPGVSNCSNLSAVDSADAFNWVCVNEPGPNAVFYSDGLKPKRGLGNLIAPGPTPAWKPVSLAVFSLSSLIAVSAAIPWDFTTLQVATSNPLPTDPVVTFGSSSATIYVVSKSQKTSGYNLNFDSIGLVVLPGRTLTYNDSTVNNCSSTTGEITSPNIRCMVSAGSQKRLIVEGKFDAGFGATNKPDYFVNFVGVSHSYVNRLYGINGGSGLGAVLGLKGSSRNAIKDLVGYKTNIPALRLELSSNNNSAVFVGAFTSNGSALWIEGSTSNKITVVKTVDAGSALFINNASSNRVSDLFAFNNRFIPIEIAGGSSALDNAIVGATVVGSNINYDSVRIGGNNTNLVNTTIINGAHNSIALSLTGDNTIVQNLFVENSGYGINGDGILGLPRRAYIFNSAIGQTSNGRMSTINGFDFKFAGVNRLHVGGGLSCNVGGSPVGSGFDASCTTLVPVDTFTGQISIPINSSFGSAGSTILGTVNDTINLHNGTSTNFNSITDWFSFENAFRGWALGKSSSYPNAIQQGICNSTSGTDDCAIFDTRLTSAGTDVRNNTFAGATPNPLPSASSCPTSLNGDQHYNRPSSPNFHSYATEIMFDGSGNDNGLCESNEHCLYTPNFGAYQGSGDYLSTTCPFIDGSFGGAITGVTMHYYPINGE